MIPRRRCRCKRRNGKILRRGVIPTKRMGRFLIMGGKTGYPVSWYTNDKEEGNFMEIEATSADRNLLLEMKGELDHHGPGTPSGSWSCPSTRRCRKTGAGPGGRDVHGQLRHRADPAGPAADATAGREPAGAERASAGTAGPGCRRHRPAGDDTIKGEYIP